MRKINLFLTALFVMFLMSCGGETTSADAVKSDGTSYKFDFSSAEDFNNHVVDAINVIDDKEKTLLEIGEEVTGQELENILNEYKETLTGIIEKLEDTKPYYAGETFLSSTIDYIKVRQEVANEVWTKIVEIVGERKINEISEEDADNIDSLLDPALDREEQALNIMQGQQNVFALANDSYVEHDEE